MSTEHPTGGIFFRKNRYLYHPQVWCVSTQKNTYWSTTPPIDCTWQGSEVQQARKKAYLKTRSRIGNCLARQFPIPASIFGEAWGRFSEHSGRAIPPRRCPEVSPEQSNFWHSHVTSVCAADDGNEITLVHISYCLLLVSSAHDKLSGETCARVTSSGCYKQCGARTG